MYDPAGISTVDPFCVHDSVSDAHAGRGVVGVGADVGADVGAGVEAVGDRIRDAGLQVV